MSYTPPATITPRPETSTYTDADAVEVMAVECPSGADTFSNRSSEMSRCYYVGAKRDNPLNQSLLRSSQTWFLGYSYADSASPWALHRVPPVAHPIWGYQFRATSVSYNYKNPCGDTTNTNNAAYEESDIVPDGINRFGIYKSAIATVKFSGPLTYYLYDDTDPEWSGLEYDRYCTKWEIEPRLDLVAAETDRSIYWVDGPTNLPNGKPFPGSINERVEKTNFKLIWHEVAEGFTHNSSGIPTKIKNAVGKVNSADWSGHGKYTLLLEGVKFTRYVFPFFSLDGRAFYNDIEFNFVKFDPTHGSGYTVSQDAGYRLLPWRHGGGANGGPGWYSVRRADASGTAPTSASTATYIAEIDFATAFTHVSS